MGHQEIISEPLYGPKRGKGALPGGYPVRHSERATMFREKISERGRSRDTEHPRRAGKRARNHALPVFSGDFPQYPHGKPSPFRRPGAMPPKRETVPHPTALAPAPPRRRAAFHSITGKLPTRGGLRHPRNRIPSRLETSLKKRGEVWRGGGETFSRKFPLPLSNRSVTRL